MGVDEEIENESKSKLSVFWQSIILRILNFTHHWYIGLLMIVYPLPYPELKWLGYGLFIEDSSWHIGNKIKSLNPFQMKEKVTTTVSD